jgi:hypothetical protein
MDADPPAGFDFVADVDLGGGIVTDKNGGQAGPYAAPCEFGDALLYFGKNLVANEIAVENSGGHCASGQPAARRKIAS